MINEILIYLSKSIVTYLNGNFKKYGEYKNKAMQIYERVKFEESCIYPVKNMVPEEIQNKLYKLVS